MPKPQCYLRYILSDFVHLRLVRMPFGRRACRATCIITSHINQFHAHLIIRYIQSPAPHSLAFSDSLPRCSPVPSRPFHYLCSTRVASFMSLCTIIEFQYQRPWSTHFVFRRIKKSTITEPVDSHLAVVKEDTARAVHVVSAPQSPPAARTSRKTSP